ncbi:Histone acetyltransferase type B catalytic subunit [Gryllus bimaculatus]|nr:Histone acetyltransferase type B catalytic subunit [Gryllus bimaculatus]
MAVSKKSTDYYITNANEALELKLVRKSEDIEDDSLAFNPEMTHQVFGDSETIFGYRDLKIKLYYSAAALTTYLGVSYTSKADVDKFDGVEADDIEGNLSKVIQRGYLTNLDDFRKAVLKDNKFVPFGELLRSFNIEAQENQPSKSYEVYQCDVKVPGFYKFHERLQTFILWYIDAASFIDIDDDKWKFFVVYEKYKVNGDTLYAVAGYATVYEYYAYPKNIRPRIGQILVMPPFQRQGLGVQLLRAIYQYYVPNPDVIDITVESPSDEFQRVRDYVDVKNFEDLVKDNPEVLKQMRRVYEILRLQYTDTKNEADYKQYRLDVKKRLNIPYQKEKADLKKLEKVLKGPEFSAVLSFDNPDVRMDTLEREFRELETQYRRILDRLSLD